MVTLIIIGIWILVALLVGLGIGRTISRADHQQTRTEQAPRQRERVLH